MCGICIDEVPQEFHKERKAAAERILEAAELALPTVQAVVADDATDDLNPEAVEVMLGLFQELVTQAIALEERIHPTALHEWLREAISTVDQSAGSQWKFVPTALMARGRSTTRRGRHKGKEKSETSPAPRQQPDAQPGTPQHFDISA
ncbi:unnamed protein product, partial [Symbiodinium sp. CCMP2456]